MSNYWVDVETGKESVLWLELPLGSGSTWRKKETWTNPAAAVDARSSHSLELRFCWIENDVLNRENWLYAPQEWDFGTLRGWKEREKTLKSNSVGKHSLLDNMEQQYNQQYDKMQVDDAMDVSVTPSATSGLPPPQLQNIVATVNLDTPLALKDIAMRARNAEYNPKRFAAVIMRIRDPKTTALIFASGKMVVTGARSEDAARVAGRKYARIIQKLGFSPKYKVRNSLSCSVLGFSFIELGGRKNEILSFVFPSQRRILSPLLFSIETKTCFCSIECISLRVWFDGHFLTFRLLYPLRVLFRRISKSKTLWRVPMLDFQSVSRVWPSVTPNSARMSPSSSLASFIVWCSQESCFSSSCLVRLFLPAQRSEAKSPQHSKWFIPCSQSTKRSSKQHWMPSYDQEIQREGPEFLVDRISNNVSQCWKVSVLRDLIRDQLPPMILCGL